MPRNFRKPMEALDQHVALIDWWQRNVNREIFAEGFAATHPARLPVALDTYLGGHLDRAATIFVTSALSDHLWRFAQEHDVEDVDLHPADLFLDNGYVWFESPLLITDVRGRICTIRALAWFRDPDRLRVFYFNDKLHPLDELTQLNYQQEGLDPGVDKTEPRTPLFHFDEHAWDEPMFAHSSAHATDDQLAEAIVRHDLAARLKREGAKIHRADDGAWYYSYNYEPVGVLPVRDGKAGGGNPYEYAIDPVTGSLSSWFTADTLAKHRDDTAALNRFLLVLWQWMGDHIPYTEMPDRSRRRALKRAKLGVPGEVLVIDLRVKDPDPFYERPENPQLVMWTHRWRSREHDRRYRNKVTGEVIKVVRVRASIKGPEHLQLIEKDRVFNVRR